MLRNGAEPRNSAGLRNDAHAWTVILAGGEGTRLQPLTRLISGDNRPKQFCPIFGGETLLAQTRTRLANAIAPERTMFVVTQSHERFYAEQLAEVNPARLVVQPSNRGTAAAILYSSLRVSRQDPEATAVFFPADHHYSEEPPLIGAVESAFEVARGEPGSIVLLGAEPQSAEVEYGWIEPGPDHDSRSGKCSRVNRFWEKPSPQMAQDLLGQGCLWNTFVMVGQIRAFLDAFEAALPELFHTFEPIAGAASPELERKRVTHVYRKIEPADFSRQVLSTYTDRLVVLRLGDTHWSDLGKPERVMATLKKKGVETASWARALAAGA